MSKETTELKSLTYFERKEYEELKYKFSEEAKRLRERKVFLGVMVVAFIATLAVAGFVKL